MLAAAITAAFALAAIFGLIWSCGPEAGAPLDEENARTAGGLEESTTTGEPTAAGSENATGEAANIPRTRRYPPSS